MKNFSVKHDGKEFWISRSLVAVMYCFAYDSEFGGWSVLAAKRGPGCPSCVGLWNCPCGYLDYDETADEAAIRETCEETGVRVPPECVEFLRFDATPSGKKQNMSAEFVAVLGDRYDYPTSAAENEPGETSAIEWIPLSNLGEFKFAFNQKKRIREVFETRVKPSWWRGPLMALVLRLGKWLGIEPYTIK